MVNQYSSNVFHLSQQKGSRLKGLVRNETQKAEAAFYDRIGSVTAQLKSGRHADTTYQDTPHSRRRVTLEDYFYADLVDKEDKLRIIQNPESEYAIAAGNALGRVMDDVVIAAALGSAYSGKTGATAVVLPDTQKLCAFDGAVAAPNVGVGLNVATLRATKKKFSENETGDSDLHFVIDAEQMDSLLGETEVTSSDYASVKALVQGDVDSFMGFKFHRSERLPLTTAATTFSELNGSVGAGTGTAAIGSRRCFAFQKEGLILAISAGMKTEIERLPQKHYATQVYASMGLGATRIEEEKVVEVICLVV